MTLRYLVPALGFAALTVTPAFAADAVPTVSFSGWSDNILTISSYSNNNPAGEDITTTAKDEGGASVRFSAAASLKAMWKVADRVDAKINLWFYPDYAEVQAREMFVNVDVTNGFSWQMGKYINHVGWISAEPTGLYTVNDSLIGYLGAYGNDVLGTAIIWHDPMKSPVSAQFHITNGYYTASDAFSPGYVTTPSTRRENSDLGFGVGVTYTDPGDKFSLDFDLVYDIHSDENGAPSSMGGDVLAVGVNATVKPVAGLVIGAEVMIMSVDDSDPVAGSAADAQQRIQGLVLANYAIPNAPANMSVTGMIQYIQIEPDTLPAGKEEDTRLQVAAVLLTNPFTSTNFGLNFEIAYAQFEGIEFDSNTGVGTTTETESDLISFAVEAIATF